MNLLRGVLSLYSWRYPTVLVYMLQSTEYQALPYLKWYWQTANFSRVMYRRSLHHTKAARLLLLALRLGMAVEVLLGLVLIGLFLWNDMQGGWQLGLALLVAYPVVWAHLAVVPLVLGRLLIVKPRQARRIKQSEAVFRDFAGRKIAIVGSYGKTSMKELLNTVLSEGLKVAATPANKNVPISHAQFATTLQGDEAVLLIEYGEGAPGDVARFASITHPTHAVITGLAPAHLDKYKTLERAGRDIISVAAYISPSSHVYVNSESLALEPFARNDFERYDQHGALGWTVRDIRIGLDGTQFTLRKGHESMHLASGLIGRHQLGPLTLAAALAHEWGMTPEQIQAGIAKTKPFEHRMQPYNLGGAWIIDDTYNGNIEGIRAGTALLRELPAQRKIYVTPGLVDQGPETARVHEDMGQLIAGAKPDIVVLMRHSVTAHIQRGLTAAGYQGEVRVEHDPLEFYTSLESFVAAGDVVLMQNDWPDNYS